MCVCVHARVCGVVWCEGVIVGWCFDVRIGLFTQHALQISATRISGMDSGENIKKKKSSTNNAVMRGWGVGGAFPIMKPHIRRIKGHVTRLIPNSVMSLCNDSPI